MRTTPWLIAVILASGCGPKTQIKDADIPMLPKLSDVMWSQAQVMDPQFKKIGQASYTDDEFTTMTAAAGRLKLTTARIKESFSKGPEFNQFADTLAMHGAEVVAAAEAKDAVKASAALAETKATCKACHSKFR